MLMQSDMLAGKKGLVVGVANSHSIAAGCAQAFSAAGADVALTFQSEKAQKHVQPVAEAVGAEMLLPLDVTDDTQMDAVFDAITARWGKLEWRWISRCIR